MYYPLPCCHLTDIGSVVAMPGPGEATAGQGSAVRCEGPGLASISRI